MADARRRTAALGSVRVRTTAAVLLVTGVAAVLGAWLLVAALGARLSDGIVLAAQTRTAEVAQTLADGTAVSDLDLVPEDDRFVHVLDSEGNIVAASPDGPAEPPVVPADDETRTDVMARLTTEDDEERYVVSAQDVAATDGQVTVVVTQEASEVDDSRAALVGTLQVGVPIALVVVGLVTWWLVGRSLAPVAAIRTQVETITSDRLQRRVPEPSTGDEIGDLARTMNQMLDRLEAAQARQRQLVSDASHELRSPATVIRQHAEVALSHPGSISTEELARMTLAEGRRLEQLVEQMLWLARSDEDASTMRLHPLDLDDLVLEEAARVRATSGLRIDATRVSGGQVRGDPLMLRRVAANLIDNAVGHAAGVVTISLLEESEAVVLRVDDDGPGIPVADRARVLERFVRLDESRSRDRGGAGLGLAIVNGIVRVHGGTLRIGESAAGGARFDVLLPRSDSVQAAVSEAFVASSRTTDDDARGGSR